jgi:DNA polymerase-3 subunit gamma/tau
LSDTELVAHLQKILGQENIRHEDAALRLLARRAAGSARDAVTLLSQVLALGGTELKEADARSVLGLAGQELFFRLLAAIRESDCACLSELTRQLLDQGIDLGFFLRELTLMWRNLFMLRQIGSAAENLLELPAAEAQKWNAEAQNMSLVHIHACWQLTLEGQRRVLTSLEPSLALELLLFNLALLPRLMPLEQLSNLERLQTPGKKEPEPADQASTAPSLPPGGATQSPHPDTDARLQATGLQPGISRDVSSRDRLHPPPDSTATGGKQEEDQGPEAEASPQDIPGDAGSSTADSREEKLAGVEDTPGKPGENNWRDFLAFCATGAAGLQFSSSFSALLHSVKADWEAAELRITPPNAFSATRLARKDSSENLRELLRAFCGKTPELRILPPPEIQHEYADLKKNIEQLPIVQALEKHLGAALIDYGPWTK